MPKLGDKREDGYIWYCGAWQSPEAVERRRARSKLYQAKDRDKARKRSKEFYEKNRNSVCEKRKARYHTTEKQRDSEKRRKYNKEHWAANKERLTERSRKWQQENADRVNSRCKAAYVAKTPTYGLQRAISEYRRGRISFDDLARLCGNALDRADELGRKIKSERRESVGDPESTRGVGEGNSGTGESQG